MLVAHVTIFCYEFLQEALEIGPGSTDDHAEPWRAALDKALQGYLKDHYPNGVVTVSVFVVLHLGSKHSS